MPKLTRRGAAFTDLVLEVFRLNRLLLDAGDELTAGVGLSSARWQVLGVVEHGAVPVSHVARIMGLTRQSVQQTANGLATEGFIEFVENPHHRRAKLLVITSKGSAAMKHVQRRHAEWANQVGSTTTIKALQAAATVLAQLRDELTASASHSAFNPSRK